jgi:dienelactone hydrolase
MRTVLVLTLALCVLSACRRVEGTPGISGPVVTSVADSEEATREHLRRMYREARAEARPSRESLVELLGIEPRDPRSPPESESRATVRGEGLLVTPFRYEAAPGMPVSALLWRPPGDGPVPAVLTTHGHFEAGKDAPAVQARCRDLASAGIAVLAIDLFGHGERAPLGHSEAAVLHSANSSLLALDVQAVVRGLDWLAAHPEVNGSQLGLAGQSGGAIVAIHAAAIDERVAATFANSGLHAWERAVLTLPQCPCNYAPNQLRLGTVADAAGLVAPRALRACHGKEDGFIPLASAVAAQAGQAYELHVRAGGHDFDREARLAQLAFFTEAFSLPAADLAGVANGLDAPLPSAFGPAGPGANAQTLQEIAAKGQRALLPERPLPAAELRRRLAEILALPGPAAPARRDASGTRLLLETEPGLLLEARLHDSARANAPTALVLGLPSITSPSESEQLQQLVEEGFQLVVADLRGQGASPGDALDYLQLHVGAAAGRPLLGGRVHDALGWYAAAESVAGEGGIAVFARGEAATIVLLADVLAPAAERLTTRLDGAALTLVAEPGGDPAWRIPHGLSVFDLASLGDLADMAEARDGSALGWWRPSGGVRRDGSAVAADDPLLRRFQGLRAPLR